MHGQALADLVPSGERRTTLAVPIDEPGPAALMQTVN
jgi:hypothetical protein